MPPKLTLPPLNMTPEELGELLMRPRSVGSNRVEKLPDGAVDAVRPEFDDLTGAD